MRYQADALATFAACIPARNADEQDATSRAARRALSVLQSPGVTKKAKTGMHRRDRRAVRRQLAAAGR